MVQLIPSTKLNIHIRTNFTDDLNMLLQIFFIGFILADDLFESFNIFPFFFYKFIII